MVINKQQKLSYSVITWNNQYTVKPVLRDHTWEVPKVVTKDRWSFKRGFQNQDFFSFVQGQKLITTINPDISYNIKWLKMCDQSWGARVLRSLSISILTWYCTLYIRCLCMLQCYMRLIAMTSYEYRSGPKFDQLATMAEWLRTLIFSTLNRSSSHRVRFEPSSGHKPSSVCRWSGGFSQGSPFLPHLMTDLAQN